MIEIVRIGPPFVDHYRQIRLKALQTGPLAFGSTFEREVLLTCEDRYRRAETLDGVDKVGFFAMSVDGPCALACCFRDEQRRSHAEVISMWVSPSHRRGGVAFTLLETIRTWARSHDVSTLRLLVTSGNDPAIGLYRRFGFSETGRSEPHPNDTRIIEIEMVRPVEE